MKRIPVVDLFRGISILITLAIHLGPLYITLPYLSPALNYAWYKLWCAGGYGVDMFFVISGYLITRVIATGPNGLFQPDFRDFYSRRAGRILPLLAAITLFGFLMLQFLPAIPSARVEYCLHHSGARFTYAFWTSITTFSFNWYKTWLGKAHPYFGLHWDVLWSLSIEEQFYLFYPLILKNLGNAKKLVVFLIYLVLLMPLVHWIGYRLYPRDVSWNSFLHFGMMAFGVLLYLAEQHYQDRLGKKPGACWFLCGIGLFFLCYFGFHSSAKIYDGTTGVWGETFIGLGLFLFLLGGLHLKIFKSRIWTPLTFPGQLSYGMYLFHASILFFIWPLMQKLGHFEAFLVFSGATTLAAYLSYRFFELPANFWIRGTFGPPKTKGA